MTNDSYEIRIPAKLVPAMLQAIGIARNTAMMSAARSNGARAVQAEFDAMEDALAAQIGAPGMFHDIDRYAFHEICTLMSSAKEYFWYVTAPYLSGDGARRLSIIIDRVEHSLGYGLKVDGPDHDRIREIVESYSSVEAVRLPDMTNWRGFDAERDLPEATSALTP